MKKIVEVKGIKIGEGQPKICIPVVARNIEEVKKQAKSIMFTPADIVEWRVDHLMNVTNIDYVLMALRKLKEQIEDKPVLVTFRTFGEGGNCDIPVSDYINICNAVIGSGMADLIDVEYFLGKNVTEPIIETAHTLGVKVVMSNHDFDKTPDADELFARLSAMKDAGADIAKVAVMPHDSGDVLKVLTAAEKMKHVENPIPVVTISMGAAGVISRVAGEFFGSAITFASAGKASAPGQMDADNLDRVTTILHDQLADAAYFAAKAEDNCDCSNDDNVDGKNIILIGFMGTGKSTVARHLARKTGMEVKEMDDMIEDAAGMRITDIFEKYGEAHFRDMETEQTRIISESQGVIVSCGGGTVMRSQNVDYLKSSGKIFLLRATPDTILERVRKGGDKRPLLNKYMSRGYISTLMKKRRDIYLAAADYVIDVDHKSSEAIAEMIMDIMGITVEQ